MTRAQNDPTALFSCARVSETTEASSSGAPLEEDMVDMMALRKKRRTRPPLPYRLSINRHLIAYLTGRSASKEPRRCNVPIPATLDPTAASGRSADHDKIAPTTIGVFRTSRNPAQDMRCHGTARPDPPFGQYSTQHGAWHAHGPTDSVRNVAQVSLMFFQYIYARMSIV